MQGLSRIENLKDRNGKDGLYKASENIIWFLFAEVFLVQLSSLFLRNYPAPPQLDKWEIWFHISIIFSFLCLLSNVFFYNSYIIKLLDESNLNRWLSFGLEILVFGLILANFWNSNLWFVILGMVTLCVWFKNNQIYKNLKKEAINTYNLKELKIRKQGLDKVDLVLEINNQIVYEKSLDIDIVEVEEAIIKANAGRTIAHPLQSAFLKWSRFSLGYACFAICAGIILFFFLNVKLDDIQKIVATFPKDSLKELSNYIENMTLNLKREKLLATAISSICVMFVLIKNCFGLFRGRTIKEYERQVDAFLFLKELSADIKKI